MADATCVVDGKGERVLANDPDRREFHLQTPGAVMAVGQQQEAAMQTASAWLWRECRTKPQTCGGRKKKTDR